MYIYIYVCMYVGMYVCMNGWMNEWMNIWIYEFMNIWIYEDMKIWIYEYMNINIYEYKYMYIYMWICIWIYICIYIYEYIYIHGITIEHWDELLVKDLGQNKLDSRCSENIDPWYVQLFFWHLPNQLTQVDEILSTTCCNLPIHNHGSYIIITMTMTITRMNSMNMFII